MEVNKIIQKLLDLEVYFKDEDIECVYKYMNKLSDELAVDLGTGWGKASLAMGLSNPDIAIHTYDTGQYPMDRGYGNDDYKKAIESRFEKYGCSNLVMHQEDARFSKTFPVALLHVDIDDIPYDEKLELYSHWFKHVSKYILVRNYHNEDRDDKKIADKLLKGWVKGKPMGIIQPLWKRNQIGTS